MIMTREILEYFKYSNNIEIRSSQSISDDDDDDDGNAC